MSKIKVYRYYRIEQIDRKTGEIVYETSLMHRDTMLRVLMAIFNSYDSDFFDVKVIPYNKKEQVHWIKNQVETFDINVDEDENSEDYFTHKKDF